MPTKHEHKEKNNKLQIIAITIGVIVVLLAAIFFTKSYPVAFVRFSPILAKNLDNAIAIGQKLDPQATKQTIFDQLVENKKKAILDGSADVTAELKYYKTGHLMDYNKFLNDYFFGKERLFVQYVAAPQATDAALHIKYNLNYGLNNDAYNRAQIILDKLNQGQSFEDLAKQYSDDKVSAQLGGDLGFVTSGQLLPELEKVIVNSKLGEVKKEIVTSRLGYHIIFPVQQSEKDGQKVWQVKHILIQTQGYDQWLNSQLQTIGVHKLMKL